MGSAEACEHRAQRWQRLLLRFTRNIPLFHCSTPNPSGQQDVQLMGKALPSPSSPEILVLNPVHEGIGAPPDLRFPRCSPVEDAVRRLHVPVLHHHRAAHEAQVVRHGCGMGPVEPGGSGARRSRSLLLAPRDTAGNPGHRKGRVLPAPLPGTRRDRREPEGNTAGTLHPTNGLPLLPVRPLPVGSRSRLTPVKPRPLCAGTGSG